MKLQRIKQLSRLPDDVVYADIDSPVGQLTLFASNRGIHNILWDIEKNTDLCLAFISRFKHDPNQDYINSANKQLNEYFSGKREKFTLPLCLDGTCFQLQAWKMLQQIPLGQTISYGEQASHLGDKNKARAVGMANSLNPISIIIPCHRVIASNGALAGFGGGLAKKKYLLTLEGCGGI